MASKKKVLIIAGHGEGDPGACSIWGQEADYTRELAGLIQKALKDKLKVTMYDQSKNCYEQSKRGNVPDYASYDLTLEVHFNAKAKKDPQGDGSFTGIGGYVHPSNTKGRKTAQAIMAEVVLLGFKQWGVFDSTGLLNLNNAQRQEAAYFLLETAFIDDGDDMKWYTENRAKAAQAIAQGILKGLGLASKAAELEEGGYFRVRLSWEDAGSQMFAGMKENAIRFCPAGYSVYDPAGKCIYTKEVPEGTAAGNEGLESAGFMVMTTCDVLNIRSGAGLGYSVVGTIREQAGHKKKYTIVEEKNGWGRLKSGAGWISLSYTRKVS